MNETQQKIDFIVEMEKLKAVLRKTRPVGLDRYENSAEHSWQTAVTGLLFLPPDLDALKVLKILLIHDIVEIDAGDVFVYDDAAREAAAETELKAAKRIFGMLPNPLGDELLDLWLEFENRGSPEAIYAKAIDRVCPNFQNLHTADSSWNENGISRERVIAKNGEIAAASPELWNNLKAQIEQATFTTKDSPK